MELDLKALKKGDEAAFEAFVRQYEKKKYHIALRHTGNEMSSCDIVQEVFLKIYRSISSFKELSSLSTWVFRITYNVCIDHLRREKKISEVSLYAENRDGEDYAIELSDLTYSPELIMERGAQRELIKRAILKLPEKQRLMIILRELEGLSYAQIAQVTGCEEGTVKSRINRAREKLRACLIQEGNFARHSQSKMAKEVAKDAL